MKSGIKSVIDDLLRGGTVEEVTEAEAFDVADLQANYTLDGLKDEINKRAGFEVPGLTITIEQLRNGEAYIQVASDNIADKAGVMAPVFAKLAIENFGGKITQREEEGGLVGWVPVTFDFNYKKGGHNAADWFTAFYNFSKDEWTFRD